MLKTSGLVVLLSLVGCQDRAIVNAQDAVRYELVDPESARFREVFHGRFDTICGQVNSKNRIGGYTGFTKFVYDGHVVALDPESVRTPLDDEETMKLRRLSFQWDSSCASEGRKRPELTGTDLLNEADKALQEVEGAIAESKRR